MTHRGPFQPLPFCVGVACPCGCHPCLADSQAGDWDAAQGGCCFGGPRVTHLVSWLWSWLGVAVTSPGQFTAAPTQGLL